MIGYQYDMGNRALNIYLDRPNKYLAQLTKCNIRLFVIGKYEGEMISGINKVEFITPDIRPDFVISQTKQENFKTLESVALDYRAVFIHFATRNEESELTTPNTILSNFALQKENINKVIELGYGSAPKLNGPPYFVAEYLPIYEMSAGVIPLVPINGYNEIYIRHGYNGFLFRNKGELMNIINNLSKMDKEDIATIGQNASTLVSNHFGKEKFIKAWQSYLRSLI